MHFEALVISVYLNDVKEKNIKYWGDFPIPLYPSGISPTLKAVGMFCLNVLSLKG